MLLNQAIFLLSAVHKSILAGLKQVPGMYPDLTNIDNVTNVDTWKNQNFQLYIGFRIYR